MAKENQQTTAVKTIRIAITSEGKIICIPHADFIPELLPKGEEIIQELFHKAPHKLGEFFRLHPEEAELFPKGFAWWVTCRLWGKEAENQKSYGMLKRKLSEFSRELFREVRNLVCIIADEIKRITRPKKLKKMNQKKSVIFDESKKPEFAYHDKKHRWFKKQKRIE